MTVAVIMGGFVLSLALSPFLGVAFFPRTDPGQFVINVKAPSGTRIELTNDYIARVEDDIREVIDKDDLAMIVSNIGVNADLSAIYTTNSAMHTAFVQVQLHEGAQDQQLRLHGPRPAKAGQRSAGAFHLFPDRRPGRFHREPGNAGAHRHSGYGQQSAGGL